MQLIFNLKRKSLLIHLIFSFNLMLKFSLKTIFLLVKTTGNVIKIGEP